MKEYKLNRFFCSNLKWGGKMQSFIWAIGSLLILVPIIYFLPLGISSRGKWMVISISFMLGILGLMAKDIFSLWKISLMLVLLLGLIAYFIEKKFGSELFITANTAGDEEKPVLEINQGIDAKVSDGYNEITPKVDEFESLQEDFSIRSNISGIDSDIDGPDATIYNESVPEIEETLIEDLQDEFQDELQDEFQVELQDGFQDELQDDYIALVKDQDEDEELLAMEIFDLKASNDAINYDKHDQREEMDETPIDSSHLDLDSVLNEEDQLAEEIFDLKTLMDESNDNEVIKEGEMEEIEEIAVSPIPEELEENIEEEFNALDSSEIEITSIEVEKDANTKDQPKVPKEMLYTMIAQLEIIGKKADAQEYEQLIKEHMHERLSVHEYYTFASLLIEHYIGIKQFDKLERLIHALRNKVKGYPILEQETEFIYNRYC